MDDFFSFLSIVATIGWFIFLIVMILRAVWALERISEAQDKMAGIDRNVMRAHDPSKVIGPDDPDADLFEGKREGI
ncbi:hypothetical protein HED60_07130 [Planctomycetales bacterium ZRK34]|nr:hypothetical protein HED60_07130 [Planctomycetales bacterium ZRK34]